MANSGNVESDLPLPVQDPGTLVQAAGQEHGPVHLEEDVFLQGH
jgi:hypothetical protein